MATAAQTTSEPLAVGAWADDGTDSKSERYLSRRLAAAGADYKGVAFTTFLLGAGVAALVWLGLGVLLEHWLVPGGLPRWARWGWLLTGLVSLVAAVVRFVVPLVRYRVNLVYAARVIEREHPELHNDLVNTVLVKAHPDASPAPVVRSLERRAAKRLSGVPSESVIDRSTAVRLAYALAAFVGLVAIYGLVAPKSVVVTASRLLAPWTRVAAPSRVRVAPPRLRWRMPADESEPDAGREIPMAGGAATIVRGRQLMVTSTIHGLRQGERPVVEVAPLSDDGTIDGAEAAWRVEMVRSGGAAAEGPRYDAVLPAAARGLDQSVAFSIRAGDARSEPVRVEVVDSPSLVVREVRYEFPAYMRREPETVAWQGDLRAVEGTRVVLVAESNQPLDAAWVDFGCDGKRDLKMKVGTSDLARAGISFPLAMNADRSAAEHASYRLLFQPRGGAGSEKRPLEADQLVHRIEVSPDLAPEIAIEEPRESPLRVPPASPVPVRIRALDPDFGLASVAVEVRLEGGPARPPIVLPDSGRQGAYTGLVRLVPQEFGAGPGSTLEYRGVATDTRPEQPNVTRTPWQSLQIDASAAPRPPVQDPPRPEPKGRDAQERGQADPRDAGGAQQPGGDSAQDPQGRPSQDPGDTEQRDRGARPEMPDRDPGADAGEDRPGAAGDGATEKERQQPTAGGGTDQPRGEKPAQGENRDGEKQGEPQPGQQDGTAAGGRRGETEPRQGGNEERGEGQGQGQGRGDKAAGNEGRGAGRGGEGKEGVGRQDGRQQQKQEGAAGARSDAGSEPGPAAGQGDRREGRGDAGDGRPDAAMQQGGPQQKNGPLNGPLNGPRGESKPRPSVAADGTNDGEAMERILEHRRQAEGQGSPDGAGKQEGGKQEGGKQAAPRDGTVGESQAGREGERPRDRGQQNPAEQRRGAESTQCQAADGKPCGKEGCSSCNGGGKAGAGEGGAGQGQQGQGQQGQGTTPEGATQPGAEGGGGWSGGAGPPPDQGAREGQSPAVETEWASQEVDHARNAADLAIEHLRDSLASGRTEVLDELGWTREEARAFLARWEAMRRQAESGDPVRRAEFERELRSLGLRPDGVQSGRDVPADVRGGQAEGRRSRPPSGYRERFKAFLQGTSGERPQSAAPGASRE